LRAIPNINIVSSLGENMKIFELTIGMLLIGSSVSSAFPIETTTYTFYPEAFDAGRRSGDTANYAYQSVIGSGIPPLTGSGDNYKQHQGVYFNVYCDVLPPTAVTNLAALSRTDGNVDLAWVQAADEESGVWGYRVYRYYFYGPEKYSNCVTEANINTPAAYQDQSDLLYGFQYIYEVRAVDYALNEQPSGNNQQIIQVVKQQNSIIDLKATSYPGGDIKLNWSAISGASYYRIYRSLVYGQKGSALSTGTSVTLPEYLDIKNNLEAGHRYYYVAQAVVTGIECTKGNNQASAISDQGGPNAPIIKSNTHPIEGQAYPNANPAFRWIRSADPGVNQDLAGYYIMLSASGTTGTAITEAGWEYISTVEKTYSAIANGTWYFHCRGKDVSGNLGAEAIYCAAILASGEIRGQVTDATSGQGLTGILQAWQTGQKKAEVKTREDRTYTLSNLPFGSYQLKFNRFGYMPILVETALSMNNTPLTINITSNSQAVIGTNEAAAYPSPATGAEVRMVYYCDEPSEVKIEIYNVSGQMVAEIKENKAAGYQYSVWPIQAVSRGVYIFRAIIRGNSGQTKITPIKKFSILK
jgi:hypothetical protein